MVRTLRLLGVQAHSRTTSCVLVEAAATNRDKSNRRMAQRPHAKAPTNSDNQALADFQRMLANTVPERRQVKRAVSGLRDKAAFLQVSMCSGLVVGNSN